MCRMIMALGSFLPDEVLKAAVNMSNGLTADHDGPILCHPNGWGMIWNSPNSRQLSVYRNMTAISESLQDAPLDKVTGNFLAVHVRHATISEKIGIEYTHPIKSHNTEVPWYMLHNGFLPTVYEKLGCRESSFDTKEYCDYIIPNLGDTLDVDSVLHKLKSLKEEGSSANAIIVNPSRVYLVHWTMASCHYKKYFSMYELTDEQNGTLYISSEIQTSIATKEKWKQLASSTVHEYDFNNLINYKKLNYC